MVVDPGGSDRNPDPAQDRPDPDLTMKNRTRIRP